MTDLKVAVLLVHVLQILLGNGVEHLGVDRVEPLLIVTIT